MLSWSMARTRSARSKKGKLIPPGVVIHQVMDRPVTLTDRPGLADGPGDIFLGPGHRLRYRQAPGEEGRQGGGKGTAGTVSMAVVQPRGGKSPDFPSVKENIRSLPGQVAALDHHIGDTQVIKLPGGICHLLFRSDLPAGQYPGLVKVGRNHQRQGQQLFLQSLAGIPGQEEVAALGHHNRVDNQLLQAVFPDFGGHDFDDTGVGQHACFGGIGADIAQDGIQLAADKLGRQVKGTLNSQGILGRDRGYGTGTVNTQGGKGLQVSLNAGTAAGIGTGNGQGFIHPLNPLFNF
ncbi:exopolyphosphatase-related proteins [Moorella thermoacetica Y72]|uniref:Exopolyphosphatase-related proteins n=1 Tax=Moorella thermoacetica Y72 TaxID=1325331 RepID=A0A0S6UGJ8_NEOTH|nr:exopolyphosphatase-related proteins [Moorella thermoacetica Y72]